MKQYRIASTNQKLRSKGFFEIFTNNELYSSYIELEEKYINVILDIIKDQSGFFLEVEFLYDVAEEQLSFYNSKERECFDRLMQWSEGTKKRIEEHELPCFIKFVLREHTRCCILNENEEVSFGYIYDFDTIVYSDTLTDEDIQFINSQGFVIEEFYFDFLSE